MYVPHPTLAPLNSRQNAFTSAPNSTPYENDVKKRPFIYEIVRTKKKR
jgi:hypothetical protein